MQIYTKKHNGTIIQLKNETFLPCAAYEVKRIVENTTVNISDSLLQCATSKKRGRPASMTGAGRPYAY